MKKAKGILANIQNFLDPGLKNRIYKTFLNLAKITL